MHPAGPSTARGALAPEVEASLARELTRLCGDPAADPAGFVARSFALDPGAFLRRMPRRETFAPTRGLVVKRFQGDVWREWCHEWRRTWAGGGERRSPARREFENLRALRALGLEVPGPIAWAEERARWRPPIGGAGRSVLAMAEVPHAENLRQRLVREGGAGARDWGRSLAAFVARLHGAHWFHRDLYLQHFVVLEPRDGRERRLALFDCGRARRLEPVPLRWIVKDLAQLLHSTPACVGPRARLEFFARYRRLRGGELGLEPRRLLARIQAKARRIAAHAPRHVDPRTAGAEDDWPRPPAKSSGIGPPSVIGEASRPAPKASSIGEARP